MAAPLSDFAVGTNNPNEEFPILCETCLGENPFVRMTKQPHAKACKVCERPFTVYRWKPGPRARYKKTELCHTCAKLKNVCQTCVLDLQYGLPVQVRDAALDDQERTAIPQSDVGREFLAENHERLLAVQGFGAGGVYNKVSKSSKTAGMLERLSHRTPYYKRNLPHLCSFYAKGTCNRGDLCPFRHEMPMTGPLANQNIKDRYFGQNDPVAEKMMKRTQGVKNAPPLVPPQDPTITTLWVGGVEEDITESDLRMKFEEYGELSSVRVVAAKRCAFVTFSHRSAAEEASAKIYNSLNIKSTPLRVAWGQRKSKAPPGVSGGGAKAAPPGVRRGMGGGVAPPPPGIKAAPAKPLYASQDPANMSARFS